MSRPLPLLHGSLQLLDFREPMVKDLAWALLAPPLLAPRMNGVQWLGTSWCERAFLDYRPRLLQLDAAPQALHDHMQQQGDRRLGSYFENLLAFWLADPANSLYRLVANHVAIREGNNTLGELDFLVQDKASGRFQHWEVAVKFYLGVQPGGDYRHWVGPGLGDRLDIKVARLLDHQLPLIERPQAAEVLVHYGISACSSVCLLKGRLFYPLGASQADWQPRAANPQHWSGWWLPAQEFAGRFADAALRWLPLPREQWLVPLRPDVRTDAGTDVGASVRIGDTHSAAGLLEQLAPGFDNRAVAVVGLRDGIEEQRGFLTPPGWPDLKTETQTL